MDCGTSAQKTHWQVERGRWMINDQQDGLGWHSREGQICSRDPRLQRHAMFLLQSWAYADMVSSMGKGSNWVRMMIDSLTHCFRIHTQKQTSPFTITLNNHHPLFIHIKMLPMIPFAKNDNDYDNYLHPQNQNHPCSCYCNVWLISFYWRVPKRL